MRDPHNHQSRGFGFITFQREDSAKQVLQNRYHDMLGKRVEVKSAVPRGQAPPPQRGPPRSSQGYGYGQPRGGAAGAGGPGYGYSGQQYGAPQAGGAAGAYDAGGNPWGVNALGGDAAGGQKPGYGYADADTVGILNATLLALDSSLGAGDLSFSVSTAHSPTVASAGDLFTITKPASAVTLTAGNEAVFYWNLKQYGFYSQS